MADEARQERRRLAAILAADVVGYAALIAADEAGTLARLRALFQEAVQPLVAAHRGRIFRLLGDAVLAEFQSAVEALRCAIALQAAVAARTTAEPDTARITLRIGIALGDVVVEGGDLFGDGVNVAARLEALAEPGGILVSAAVAEQAGGRVDCALEDAGPLALKNVPRPVPAFRVRADAVPMALSTLLAPGPPSLVVLPFNNLSGDPAEDYFADGITEELTTALARVRWFHVVARNPAFASRGRHIDLRQVERELGVRYALEGSVRRAGGRLRITGQLVDVETGRHIWADRVEGTTEDVFALQDAVTEAVASAIEPMLKRVEIERARAKPAGSLDAYDLYLRALPLRLRATREDNDAALALLRQAMVLDPGFAPAKAHALHCYIQRANKGWDHPGERDEGIRLAREALVAHGNDPLMLTGAVHALGVFADDTAGALAIATRALMLNPNLAEVQSAAGWANFWAGNTEASIAHFRRAIGLSPHDMSIGHRYSGLGFALLVAGQPAEALACAEAALRELPANAPGHRVRIAALHTARSQGRGGCRRPPLPGGGAGQGRCE
jgi:TolB-like protein